MEYLQIIYLQHCSLCIGDYLKKYSGLTFHDTLNFAYSPADLYFDPQICGRQREHEEDCCLLVSNVNFLGCFGGLSAIAFKSFMSLSPTLMYLSNGCPIKLVFPLGWNNEDSQKLGLYLQLSHNSTQNHNSIPRFLQS